MFFPFWFFELGGGRTLDPFYKGDSSSGGGSAFYSLSVGCS